jgi:hypothetical protein
VNFKTPRGLSEKMPMPKMFHKKMRKLPCCFFVLFFTAFLWKFLCMGSSKQNPCQKVETVSQKNENNSVSFFVRIVFYCVFGCFFAWGVQEHEKYIRRKHNAKTKISTKAPTNLRLRPTWVFGGGRGCAPCYYRWIPHKPGSTWRRLARAPLFLDRF